MTLDPKTDLYPRLVELSGARQFFSTVDVGVVWLGEGCLQLRQLLLQNTFSQIKNLTRR